MPPRLDPDALAQALRDLPGWELDEGAGEPRLTRSLRFPDFAAALAFTDRVGALAEQHDHHPALLTEWGRVTVSWWTHTAGGVTSADVAMARRTSELAERA